MLTRSMRTRMAAAVFAAAVSVSSPAVASQDVLTGCEDPKTYYQDCRVDWTVAERLAETNADAAFLMAWRLLSDAGGKLDQKSARAVEDHLLNAADADHPQATLMLAKHYLDKSAARDRKQQMLELAVGYAERADRLEARGSTALALLALAQLAQITKDRLTTQRATKFLMRLSQQKDPFVDISLVSKLGRTTKPEEVKQLARAHQRLAISTPHLNSALKVYELYREHDFLKPDATKWMWLYIAADTGLPFAGKEMEKLSAAGVLTSKAGSAARRDADAWFESRRFDLKTGLAQIADWCSAMRKGDKTCAARSWRFFAHCGYPVQVMSKYAKTLDFSNCLAGRLERFDRQTKQ